MRNAPVMLPESNQMTSVTEMGRGGTAETIRRCRQSPVFVLSHNRPVAVVLGIDTYNDVRERLNQLEDMYDAALAELRLKESGDKALSWDETMAGLGITRKDLDEAPEEELE